MIRDGVTHKLARAMMVCAFSLSAFSAEDPSLTLDFPTCTNGIFGFTLNGQFGTRYVIEASTDLQAWTPVLTNDGPALSRALTASAAGDSAFYRAKQGPWVFKAIAILARTNINLNGNAMIIDSFDSSDTVDFPGGQWNATNRRANGNIASSYGLISAGNTSTMGKVFTGPTGSVSLTSQGSVGDVAWVTGGNLGIESGWYASNFSLVFPDVTAPYTSGTTPPTGTAPNAYVLGSDIYYTNGDLSVGNNRTLLVTGHAILYVTGKVSLANNALVNIQSNASLTLYVGGSSANLSQIVTPGDASTFRYYGLPTNTVISWNLTSTSSGTIYAPEASLTLNGVGTGPVDVVGAYVINNLICNGNFSIHYDENLTGP